MPMQLIHPTLQDISTRFPEPVLQNIARQVQEEFKPDAESCSAWRDMNAQWMETYFQKDKTKKPFEGASEDSLPILAEACDQFHARASKAMFPSRGRKIIRCVPTGAVDTFSLERAARVEKYLQWLLCERGTGYRQAKDAMLMSLPLHGCMFTKTFLDPITGRLTVKNVRATDLICPYGVGPRSLEDLPRKTEIQWVPTHYAQRLTAAGFFNSMPALWNSRGELVDRNPADDVIDTIMGFQEGQRDASDYCLLLEQHRFLDLDEDGVDEPYIVWLDAVSQRVLRLQIRYETDEAGVPVAGKEPLEQYTQYNFVPNPNGLYGIGHGLKIGAVNQALNRLLRISLDSAMLAAVGNASGIMSKSIGIKKGDLELKLGKFITTETPIEDIRSQIMPFSFPGPNAAGINLMELLAGRADRLAMVTEALTGQTQAVMQPTTVMALLEQSNIVFSAVFERILVSWESELAKVYRTTRMYMSETEYFVVIDANEPLLAEIASNDFGEDFQIQVLSDPDQLTLKERLAKAEATYQASLNNPVIQQSPMHMRNALVRYLEALDVDNIDEIVPNIQMVQAWMEMQSQRVPPEIQLEMMKAQSRGEELKLKSLADAQSKAAELQAKQTLEERSLDVQQTIESQKADLEHTRFLEELRSKEQVARAQAIENRRMEQAKLAATSKQAAQETAIKAEVERTRLAAEERMAEADREAKAKSEASAHEVELAKLELERQALELEKLKFEWEVRQAEAAAATPVETPVEEGPDPLETARLDHQRQTDQARLELDGRRLEMEAQLRERELELQKLKLEMEQARQEEDAKARQPELPLAEDKEPVPDPNHEALEALIAESKKQTAELTKLAAASRRVTVKRGIDGRIESAELQIGSSDAKDE